MLFFKNPFVKGKASYAFSILNSSSKLTVLAFVLFVFISGTSYAGLFAQDCTIDTLSTGPLDFKVEGYDAAKPSHPNDSTLITVKGVNPYFVNLMRLEIQLTLNESLSPQAYIDPENIVCSVCTSGVAKIKANISEDGSVITLQFTALDGNSSNGVSQLIEIYLYAISINPELLDIRMLDGGLVMVENLSFKQGEESSLSSYPELHIWQQASENQIVIEEMSQIEEFMLIELQTGREILRVRPGINASNKIALPPFVQGVFIAKIRLKNGLEIRKKLMIL